MANEPDARFPVDESTVHELIRDARYLQAQRVAYDQVLRAPMDSAGKVSPEDVSAAFEAGVACLVQSGIPVDEARANLQALITADATGCLSPGGAGSGTEPKRTKGGSTSTSDQHSNKRSEIPAEERSSTTQPHRTEDVAVGTPASCVVLAGFLWLATAFGIMDTIMRGMEERDRLRELNIPNKVDQAAVKGMLLLCGLYALAGFGALAGIRWVVWVIMIVAGVRFAGDITFGLAGLIATDKNYLLNIVFAGISMALSLWCLHQLQLSGRSRARRRSGEADRPQAGG